jgi:H+/Cl- antiporter ClcA
MYCSHASPTSNSAGFNAPLAGVFFALEVMNEAFRNSDQKLLMAKLNSTTLSGTTGITSSFLSSTGCISAVLLSSVLSALVSRTLLGNSLVFKLSIYSLNTPLIEMPAYLVLGALSGVVAFLFSLTANASQNFFNGKLGPEILRENMRNVPKFFKPALGGLICGLVSLTYPQILFFGYETLNSLLASSAFTNNMGTVLQLLVVKLIATGICAGSGLVGGTLAPSLFLGAMLGAAFHGALVPLFTSLDASSLSSLASSSLDAGSASILRDNLSDVQAYTIVGAGSVLAALFRAPLTASLLLFELTRDYDVILPLMASAGIGSVVGDILEGRWKESSRLESPNVMGSANNNVPPLVATAVAVGTSAAVPSRPILSNRNHREDDTVSWGDLSTSDDAIELVEEQSEIVEDETEVVDVDTKIQ